MFKHILVPTDGSTLSQDTVTHTVHDRLDEAAKEILDDAERQMREAGVPCQRAVLTSNSPWKLIIQAAEAQGCDLIFMASHGRTGVSALLRGSETQKVLTHTKIPVLVYR